MPSREWTVGSIHRPSITQMDVHDVRRETRARKTCSLIRDKGVPVACLFGKHDGEIYEVGKIAVAASHRKLGLCRSMIEAASQLARRKGCRTLQLFARVELTENHETYRRLGFAVTGPFTHPGFDRPTAYVFQRPL
jgi:GNAT superfamily N-acetyltransferase